MDAAELGVLVDDAREHPRSARSSAGSPRSPSRGSRDPRARVVAMTSRGSFRPPEMKNLMFAWTSSSDSMPASIRTRRTVSSATSQAAVIASSTSRLARSQRSHVSWSSAATRSWERTFDLIRRTLRTASIGAWLRSPGSANRSPGCSRWRTSSRTSRRRCARGSTSSPSAHGSYCLASRTSSPGTRASRPRPRSPWRWASPVTCASSSSSSKTRGSPSGVSTSSDTASGFHHLGVTTVEFDADVRAPCPAGARSRLRGEGADGGRAAYVDTTADLPGHIELDGATDGFFPRLYTALLGWDGSNPVRPFEQDRRNRDPDAPPRTRA